MHRRTMPANNSLFVHYFFLPFPSHTIRVKGTCRERIPTFLSLPRETVFPFVCPKFRKVSIHMSHVQTPAPERIALRALSDSEGHRACLCNCDQLCTLLVSYKSLSEFYTIWEAVGKKAPLESILYRLGGDRNTCTT